MFKKLMLVASLTALSSVANAAQITDIECISNGSYVTINVAISHRSEDNGKWIDIYARDSSHNAYLYTETLKFKHQNKPVYNYSFHMLNNNIVYYSVYAPYVMSPEGEQNTNFYQFSCN